MIHPQTGKLVYEFDPVHNKARLQNCPIREMGSVWDIQVLQDFLGNRDLQNHVDGWMKEFMKNIVESSSESSQGSSFYIMNGKRLQEPASIAHSAFMILCLAYYKGKAIEDRLQIIKRFADGIVHQQRSDGSFKIYFAKHADSGQSFYPGEAMLALLAAFQQTHETMYLESVEKAFPFYRSFYDKGNITEDEIVFFANWQSQAFVLLWKLTKNAQLKDDILKYILELHDRIIAMKFYSELATSPKSYATVEVGCGLEGIADAYVMIPKDDKRKDEYLKAIQSAVKFLLMIQCKPGETGVPPRAVGGFPHGMHNHTQRIDVTGHAMNAFIKVIQHCL
jgi:hypothetical protein